MKPAVVVLWLAVVGAVFWVTLSDTIVGSSQVSEPTPIVGTASSTTRPPVPEAVQTALPPTVPTTRPAPPEAEADASSEIHVLQGGTVAISYERSSIRVLWASPAEANTVSTEELDEGLRVSFSGDAGTSTIESWWDAGPQWNITDGDGQ